MSIFKFYDEATSGTDYVNPVPMFLSNPDDAAITLTVKPNQAFLYSPLKTNVSMLAAVRNLPVLIAAQAATDYATTTNGNGTGAKVRATTTNVGNGKFADFPGNSTFSGAAGVAASSKYTPTTDGDGTGFQVTFTQSVAGNFNPGNVTINNPGSGYAVGDELVFEVGGQEVTVTVTVDCFTEMYQLSALIPDPDELGANYLAGDFLYFTMSETVEEVVYTYPVQFQIPAAAISVTNFTYVLGIGETTPFTVETFAVGATTDVLAHT